jgi:hypothetical protein
MYGLSSTSLLDQLMDLVAQLGREALAHIVQDVQDAEGVRDALPEHTGGPKGGWLTTKQE